MRLRNKRRDWWQTATAKVRYEMKPDAILKLSKKLKVTCDNQNLQAWSVLQQWPHSLMVTKIKTNFCQFWVKIEIHFQPIQTLIQARYSPTLPLIMSEQSSESLHEENSDRGAKKCHVKVPESRAQAKKWTKTGKAHCNRGKRSRIGWASRFQTFYCIGDLNTIMALCQSYLSQVEH